MMDIVQTAMLGGLAYTALRDAIFAHPTAVEGRVVLFANPPAAAEPAHFPPSIELGLQLQNLCREQAEVDRKKAEELARLRAIQDRD